MKAVLVGLGVAGYSWYKTLKNQGNIQISVVEIDPSARPKVGDDPVNFYTSLNEAIEQEKPDFIVNVTSPTAHTSINNVAFDYHLPVLCEKPISFDYAESIQVVQRAANEQIPFMIAENYRRMAHFRKLRSLIEEGTIGKIASIDVNFYRYHQVERKYTVSLLQDITVHHLDLMRYLTGQEGTKMFAKLYNPIGSWADDSSRCINLYMLLEMGEGILVTYTGGISSRGKQTEWGGNWRIEGTEGAIEIVGKKITIERNGDTTEISDYSDVHSVGTLKEFLLSLEQKRDAETSGKDYLKTQALVHFAEESSKVNRMLEITFPEIRS
ncbi:MAG: gfo/Idh/MocA family oxidoreductase [Bacilli bacterium]|nr:gfo/Idh/MocA family oxidoreductase [Bacilli bacterium]